MLCPSLPPLPSCHSFRGKGTYEQQALLGVAMVSPLHRVKLLQRCKSDGRPKPIEETLVQSFFLEHHSLWERGFTGYWP